MISLYVIQDLFCYYVESQVYNQVNVKEICIQIEKVAEIYIFHDPKNFHDQEITSRSVMVVERPALIFLSRWPEVFLNSFVLSSNTLSLQFSDFLVSSNFLITYDARLFLSFFWRLQLMNTQNVQQGLYLILKIEFGLKRL